MFKTESPACLSFPGFLYLNSIAYAMHLLIIKKEVPYARTLSVEIIFKFIKTSVFLVLFKDGIIIFYSTILTKLYK